MKKIYAILFAMFALSGAVNAAEYMTADEVKALMNDKTFDGIYLPKDKLFKVYEAPDGTHNVYYPKKDKHSKDRQWMVNDKGQHCTTGKKWDGYRCAFVKDAGNGEYHKINDDGEHTHTLSNFRDGNQL